MDDEQRTRIAASGVGTVLAVSLGEAWLLELRNAKGVVEFLPAPRGELDLFDRWSGELLATAGIRRQECWQSAPNAFGYVVETLDGQA